MSLDNSSSESIDLSNCFLSDDTTNLTKWRFPDSASIIPPEGYLLIWCDDNAEQGSLHANFKLSSSGETIILSTNNGFTIIDRITFDQQSSDFSYGRESDGYAVWAISTPTPYASNGLLLTSIDKTYKVKFFLYLAKYYPPLTYQILIHLIF